MVGRGRIGSATALRGRRVGVAYGEPMTEPASAAPHRLVDAIDRRLPAVLVDSPISRLGMAFATAVALAYALPLSTGRVERRGDLLVCRGLPRWSFRRGGTCVGRVYLTADNVTEPVLRHEAVHVEQWRRYGMLFPLLYALAGNDPLRNRFEIEAGLADGGYTRRSGSTADGTRSSQPSSRSS